MVLLGRMSNFTDFDPLGHDPRAHLFYIHDAAEIRAADIILPGSKNTIDDPIMLKNSGLAAAIVRAHRVGKTVVGTYAATRCWVARWRTPPAWKAAWLPPLAWVCCPCAT